MTKILITGDSFAADWTIKYKNNGVGWPNLLADTYDVTNIAQAGCSEYRIYKQLTSRKLNEYDIIIVSHTSPYRFYVDENPIHKDDILHHSCDFIYNDVIQHYTTDKSLLPIVEFFEKYYDLDYALYVHNLIAEDIINMVPNAIHINNFEDNAQVIQDIAMDFSHLFDSNNGKMNHYDDYANSVIFDYITKRIEER